MITMSPEKTRTAATLDRLDVSAVEPGPEWLYASRWAAFERFRQLGLPDTHHEDWRFTNIAPIKQTAFTLSSPAPNLTRSVIEPLLIPGLDCCRLVFVNGRYQPSLSDTAGLPPGMGLWSLHEAFTTKRSLLEEHLGKLTNTDKRPFAALNTALFRDGAVIFVPRGAAVSRPIHLLHITAPGDEPPLISPRHLIVTEADTTLSVIEDYATLGDGVYLTNALTEIVVGPNAQVTHYLLERESPRAFNVTTLHVHQGRDSRFASHSAQFGGSIVRNNVSPVHAGEGGHSLLNGLYVLRDDQLVDNHMRVDHATPHCDSRQFYKGIMTQRSHGVFRGRIIVRQDAQKTDAKQNNQNLLLSEEAGANADPQLEIYADDVKCTHGATVGQIDEDQVFYLRSRGIPHETARAMIVYAFASENLERMPLQPVRQLVQRLLLDRLPHGKLLEQTL